MGQQQYVAMKGMFDLEKEMEREVLWPYIKGRHVEEGTVLGYFNIIYG